MISVIQHSSLLDIQFLNYYIFIKIVIIWNHSGAVFFRMLKLFQIHTF